MLCITCKNAHDGTYGSGKFCCRACANSRVKTAEVKQKVSETMKQGIKEGRIKTGNAKGVKHTVKRTSQHATRISSGIKQYWDERGRKTDEQKRAGVKAGVYAYRARKKNAIPPDADLALIKRIYEAAPSGYQIDHIIPLAKGGLHHQNNLQYLPLGENQSKGARLDYVSTNAIKWQDIIKF